jgi:hypothetical protein
MICHNPFHHMAHGWTGTIKPLAAVDHNPTSAGMSKTDKARIQAHFTFQPSQLRLNLDPYAPKRPVPVQARVLEWAGTPSLKWKECG